MAFHRDVITSVQLRSVTQTSASGDYTPGSSQWDIGITSMLSSGIDSISNAINRFILVYVWYEWQCLKQTKFSFEF